MPVELSPLQRRAVAAHGTILLTGPAGTGKSTVLHHRLSNLLAAGEPAYTILVLVADAVQIEPYRTHLHAMGPGAYGDLKIDHFSNLARDMVTLFWPLVARPAGFDSAHRPPTFLGYDLAQLLMWRIVTPMVQDGAFAGLRLRPQQVVSQLLDTLNRAALNNLDIAAATQRQLDSWHGEPEQQANLLQALEAATAFREHCLAHNLLDLSLTIDTFNRHVLGQPQFADYFSERFRHLMVDNVEEQTPAGQRFIGRLMRSTASSMVVLDTSAGYRRFLAADPAGSAALAAHADVVFNFETPFTTSPALRTLGRVVRHHLLGTAAPVDPTPNWADDAVLDVVYGRYRREMIVALAERLRHLIDTQAIAPRDIAIVTPYLDGALHHILLQALRRSRIPSNVVRRRASPRDEPRVRAWLTWLALAHPHWGIMPAPFDVAEALTLSIAGLDPARAALAADVLYQEAPPLLRPADALSADLHDRIGDDNVQRIEAIGRWLANARDAYRLDAFFFHLFSELLSQPAFQPEPDVAGASVCDWLMQTAARLLEAGDALGLNSHAALGVAFLTSINQGLVTSQPPDMGDPPDPDGVTISTIYGYLLRGRPAAVQVWLDTAASGWWDIPRQPLSNAFVLTQSWDEGRVWTMEDDVAIRNELLAAVVQGLVSRCTGAIILATSDLDRRGQRQDGPLWRALAPYVDPVLPLTSAD